MTFSVSHNSADERARAEREKRMNVGVVPNPIHGDAPVSVRVDGEGPTYAVIGVVGAPGEEVGLSFDAESRSWHGFSGGDDGSS